MWNVDTTLYRVIQRSPTVKSFQFKIENLEYLAGQFFFVTINVNGEDALHHFSFSSSPTENYIEFTKRITNSDYSKALDVMKPGDASKLRGPFGTFVLPVEMTPLIFLCGGIGVTPLRSMLRYIADKAINFDVILLYGARNIEEIVFHDELNEMAEAHPNIKIGYVLSGNDIPSDWIGKRGQIDKGLISGLTPDYKDRLFYISGPPKMVASIMEQVEQLGVPPNRIKHDSFTGYD